MEIQSSFKLFMSWMIRRLIFPVVIVCLLWLLLPKIQHIPLDGFQWWSTIAVPIAILFGMIPFIYFLMIPQSVIISKHDIVLRYLRRNCSIRKSTIKNKSLIQSGRRPGALKISIGDHNSHMINLVAFSDSDREVLCAEILGSCPSISTKPTKHLDLDYADWLPERLLGSKLNARIWNWGTKISILIPLQIRPSSSKDGYIKYQRINAVLCFCVLLPFAGILSLGAFVFSLVSLLDKEPVTAGKVLLMLTTNGLISYVLLSLIIGSYSRMKLLKRIKEDRNKK